MINTSAHPPPQFAILAELEAKPDGVLEDLARRYGVALQVVLNLLPETMIKSAPGSQFEAIWRELTTWGPVTFIVHTDDGVFETKASLAPGSLGRGHFNIHGDSPLGGHIRADRCAEIYFIDRPFFGRRSCSLQFINAEGDAMFKVFVARDESHAPSAEQVAKFEQLRRSKTGSKLG